jgi:hypothetical protein
MIDLADFENDLDPRTYAALRDRTHPLGGLAMPETVDELVCLLAHVELAGAPPIPVSVLQRMLDAPPMPPPKDSDYQALRWQWIQRGVPPYLPDAVLLSQWDTWRTRAVWRVLMPSPDAPAILKVGAVVIQEDGPFYQYCRDEIDAVREELVRRGLLDMHPMQPPPKPGDGP